MQPIVTDGVAVVCLSVGLSLVTPVKTPEPIEMSFVILTRVGLGKRVLGGGAHCRNLADMTEP